MWSIRVTINVSCCLYHGNATDQCVISTVMVNLFYPRCHIEIPRRPALFISYYSSLDDKFIMLCDEYDIRFHVKLSSGFLSQLVQRNRDRGTGSSMHGVQICGPKHT
ncbi:hypothetical protein V6N13_127520 [Hibiscus sabdariffa]